MRLKIWWKPNCMPFLNVWNIFRVFLKLHLTKYVLNVSVPFLTRAGWPGLLSMPCCCCCQDGERGHAWSDDSDCAHARQSRCAWPASCDNCSAHAPPPHKLLSSSGARRLQLRPWSSSYFHGDTHRFHLNNFKSIKVWYGCYCCFGTLCGMQISMCKMHHVHHLKLLQTLRPI